MSKKIKNHRHTELFRLLDFLKERNVRFRRIFLVGDIIENWYFRAERKLIRKFGRKKFNKLFDRLDALATRVCLKVYIIGNHDSFSYVPGLPPKIAHYLKERDYEIAEKFETADLVVLHGHQGQYGKIFWFTNIFLLRLLHLLSYLIPSIFRRMEDFYRKHFNFDRNETPEQVQKYYNVLREKAEQGNRHLICGHTHQCMADRNLRVMNTGDWIESGTFIIQDGLDFHGLEFHSKKKIFEKFFYLF